MIFAFDYINIGGTILNHLTGSLGPNLSEPIKLDINPELQSMINSNQPTGPVYQPPKVAPPPQKPAVKTFSPEPKSFSPVQQQSSPSPVAVSPAPRVAPAPAARSQPSAPVSQPQAAAPQGNGDYHDLRNPQKSGVMRLPTVNFTQKPLGPTKPVDKKEKSQNSNFGKKIQTQKSSPGENTNVTLIKNIFRTCL